MNLIVYANDWKVSVNDPMHLPLKLHRSRFKNHKKVIPVALIWWQLNVHYIQIIGVHSYASLVSCSFTSLLYRKRERWSAREIYFIESIFSL